MIGQLGKALLYELYIYTHTYIYIIHTVRVHIYVCIYTYIYIYSHNYLYIYIYIYILKATQFDESSNFLNKDSDASTSVSLTRLGSLRASASAVSSSGPCLKLYRTSLPSGVLVPSRSEHTQTHTGH